MLCAVLERRIHVPSLLFDNLVFFSFYEVTSHFFVNYDMGGFFASPQFGWFDDKRNHSVQVRFV